MGPYFSVIFELVDSWPLSHSSAECAKAQTIEWEVGDKKQARKPSDSWNDA